MILSRLIYSSKVFNVELSQSYIAKILSKSVENNRSNNVTGVLAFTGIFFVQCIEGERSSISNLYNKISIDLRHVDVTLLSFRQIDYRLFPRWSMGYLGNIHEMKEMLFRVGGAQEFNPHIMSEGGALSLLAIFAQYLEHKDP